MTIAEYLNAIKARLLSDPIVSEFHIVRERDTDLDGHLRARVKLIDGGQLEFSEYAQSGVDGQIVVVTYSYHWVDAAGRLVKRWDNVPHHPEKAGFPHHVHIGATGAVEPGVPLDIFIVLDEISRALTS